MLITFSLLHLLFAPFLSLGQVLKRSHCTNEQGGGRDWDGGVGVGVGEREAGDIIEIQWEEPNMHV